MSGFGECDWLSQIVKYDWASHSHKGNVIGKLSVNVVWVTHDFGDSVFALLTFRHEDIILIDNGNVAAGKMSSTVSS